MISLLLLCLASLGAATRCYGIDGEWENELGSHMTLKTVGDQFRGTYVSAVGAVNGTYSLDGKFETACENPTLAFSVIWNNANLTTRSVTAWTGVLINDVIYATWLLTVSVNTTSSVWGATRVGTNRFSRVK